MLDWYHVVLLPTLAFMLFAASAVAFLLFGVMKQHRLVTHILVRLGLSVVMLVCALILVQFSTLLR